MIDLSLTFFKTNNNETAKYTIVGKRILNLEFEFCGAIYRIERKR